MFVLLCGCSDCAWVVGYGLLDVYLIILFGICGYC